MDTLAFNIAGGTTLTSLALLVIWAIGGKRADPAAAGSATAQSVATAPTKPQVDAPLQPHSGLVRAIEERSRFSAASFERDCLQLFRRVAAHCEAQRAAGSPDEASAARLPFLLEQTCHALGYRQAMLLPPDAQPEDIEPRSYRWTLGLVVVSMLTDICASAEWATALSASDAPARHAELRKALAQWLDPAALAWLFEDEPLVQHLWASMSAQGHPTVLTHLVECGRCALLDLPVPAKPRGSHARPALAPPPAQPRVIASNAPPAASVETPAAEPAEPAPPATTTVAAQTPASDADPAQAFMAWVSAGIADASLPMNAPGAHVHFVSDGMVLVAPAIFNDYAQARLGAEAAPADMALHARTAQQAVYAADWHMRGPQGSHLHRFQFGRNSATSSPTVLRGLLLSNPKRFMAKAMPLNATLSRLM